MDRSAAATAQQGRRAPGESVLPFQEWTASPQADAALTAIAGWAEQAPGVMGVHLDHDSQSVVVTYSSDESPESVRGLNGAALRVLDKRVKLKLQASCFTVGAVDRALEVLSSRAWAKGESFPIGWGYRPDDGRVLVTLPTSAAAAAERLQALVGDVVAVRFSDGELGRTAGRFDDDPPHYAGAQLNINNVPTCTAGFAMDINSRRWITTAGHCSGEGVTYQNGGNDYYGVSRSRFFANPDLMLVGNTAGNFTNRIYTDPGSPTTRTVTSKVRSGVLNFCLSGHVTRAVCGVELVADNSTYCDDYNNVSTCTFALYYVNSPTGANIIAGGDSGGPAYGRTGTTAASARGMIIARDGTTAGWIQRIGTMEDAYGGIIALTPCTGC